MDAWRERSLPGSPVLGPVRHYRIPVTPQTFARIHTQLPCSATSLTNTLTRCVQPPPADPARLRGGKNEKREKRKEKREKRKEKKRVVGVRNRAR